jgi:hypothetical protein
MQSMRTSKYTLRGVTRTLRALFMTAALASVLPANSVYSSEVTMLTNAMCVCL